MNATRSRVVRAVPLGVPLGVLLGATLAVAPTAPAEAAACAPGTGVTVVVEFGALGGGSSAVCDPGGVGDSAKTVTERAGFPLDPVATQPAFVCRVSGKPASDPCQRTPPSDAYWGLFWSDGKGGWKYSSTSASALKVPAGGSIGWRWQDGGGTSAPATAPNRGSAPEPESRPDPEPGRVEKPRGDGSSGDDGRQGSAPDEPTPSAQPSPDGSAGGERGERSRDEKGRDKGKADRGERKGDRRPDATGSATPTADPTEDVTEGLAPVSADADDGDGGDPTMLLVAGAAVLVLGAAAGLTAWRRRS